MLFRQLPRALKVWFALIASSFVVSAAFADSARINAPVVPYSMPEWLKTQLQGRDEAVALYALRTPNAEAELSALQADDGALDDQLVALVAVTPKGDLHFSAKRQSFALTQVSASARRGRDALDYSDPCLAVPSKGDVLEAQYSGAGWSGVVTLRVQEFIPFVLQNNTLTPTQPSNPATCSKHVGSQTYYIGKLRLKRGTAKPISVPVVGYRLALPPLPGDSP